MPVPQIILFRDTSGSLRAEAPGRNGTRRKIELPQGKANRVQQIEALLRDLEDQDLLIQAENSRLSMAARIEREDPILARERRIAVEKAAHLAKWNAYLDSLSPSARAFKIAERDEKLTKAQEAAASRKRQLWLHTAKDHTVELANRVIPKASERPSRTFKISGTPGSFSPRTFAGDTTKPIYTKKPGSGSGNAKSGRVIPNLKISI